MLCNVVFYYNFMIFINLILNIFLIHVVLYSLYFILLLVYCDFNNLMMICKNSVNP